MCVLCIENYRRHEDLHSIKHIFPQITNTFSREKSLRLKMGKVRFWMVFQVNYSFPGPLSSTCLPKTQLLTFSMSPVIQRLSSRTQFTLVMSLYSNISPCRQTNLPQCCTYRTFALGKSSEGIESMRYCFFH